MLRRLASTTGGAGWAHGGAVAWPLAASMLPGFLTDDLLGLPPVAEPMLAIWLMIWQSARQVHPETTLMDALRRLRFGLKAWWLRQDWRPLQIAPAHSQLGQVVRARQGRMHLVAWSYLHRGWGVRRRVDVVHAHYQCVEAHDWLQLPLEGRQVIARLDACSPGLSLQLERPQWIENEGELALSLFQGDIRLYTASFLFCPHRGQPALLVGAIQGKHQEGVNAVYAELTKQLHGCRPRDLVVHGVLFIGEALSLAKAYGVSDGCRHHRAARFRREESAPTCNYDEVWSDRGGVPGDDGFFAMDTAFRPRDLAGVASKKRAMYRRRYEMLGAVRAGIHHLARENRRPDQLLHEPAQ